MCRVLYSKAMKKLGILLLVGLLYIGCKKERGERLFQLLYPNFTFTLPSGISPFSAPTFAFNNESTSIDLYLQENNSDTSVIAAINPYSAVISSLNNTAFDFLDGVSVRICPAGIVECDAFDEAFYLDNMRNRSYRDIELLPTLRNFKPLLSEKNYRVEVVFLMNDFTPVTIECKFDMAFEAVR